MLSFDRCEEESCGGETDKSPEYKPVKMHSLMPDLATGWKPKNIKIPSPILIKYKAPLTQMILDHYQSQPERIIYLGPRFADSLRFHERMPHEYALKYGITSQDVPEQLKRRLAAEEEAGRPFEGMNPKINSHLVFESRFQSGNLDLVIKIGENEYQLFLRPDTNTSGHMQWFHFTIKNQHKHKIRLHICNNRKANTLYQRGMKPYVLSKYAQNTRSIFWEQKGQNLTYNPLVLHELETEGRKIPEGHYCMSFDYQFQSQQDETTFAYCPPYTYSQLRNHISALKKNSNSDTFIGEQKFCCSLSGMDVPILTITDPSSDDGEKQTVLAVGRFHPGQANASHVVEGFLNYLVSQQAKQLRKQAVFKVIPMINPDGVVFGNYRTSLSGKDLNRQFRTKNQDLVPQVLQLKNYIRRLRDEGTKIAYFLDFHGHSVKKNVFTYGPQYDIWTVKYQKAKVLPRAVASRCDAFRLKSCLFKVAPLKRSTARAYMLTHIPYCYTVQSSIGLYRDNINRDHPFSIRKWKQVGSNFGEALGEVIARMAEVTGNAKMRKQRKLRKDESARMSSKQNDVPQPIRKTEQTLPASGSRKYLNPIRNIKRRPAACQDRSMCKIQEQECESDHFSQGNSDCESDDNDLPKIEYERLREKIVNLIDTFQVLMVGKKKAAASVDKRDRRIIKVKKSRDHRKKSTEEMLLVPSLKHKLGKIASEKRIPFLNSLHSIDPSLHHFRPPRLDKLERE